MRSNRRWLDRRIASARMARIGAKLPMSDRTTSPQELPIGAIRNIRQDQLSWLVFLRFPIGVASADSATRSGSRHGRMTAAVPRSTWGRARPDRSSAAGCPVQRIIVEMLLSRPQAVEAEIGGEPGQPDFLVRHARASEQSSPAVAGRHHHHADIHGALLRSLCAANFGSELPPAGELGRRCRA
jgi:hypothetical protein